MTKKLAGAVAVALLPMMLLPVSAALAIIPSTPDLGKAEAKCRGGEQGPALLVQIDGLKDRSGNLKLEVYPSNDADFLQDDNILISAGKAFRRVEVAVPDKGIVELCARVPGPGVYSVSVLHDRDSNRKFGLSVDGIGFTGNPRLYFSKPKAAKTRITAGAGLTRATVVMNYRRGLGMSPLPKR